MKNQLTLAVLLVASTTIVPACATKSFVRTSVADVNNRVETLTRSVDETQERARVMDTRLAEVDRTAQNAHGTAQRAHATATAAEARAESAVGKAEAVEAASKRVVYSLVLSEDQGNFAFGKATLPDVAKTRIDELAAKITADPQGAFFEIEGHTDAIGSSAYNDRLGLKRAEMVKRYLYENHQIPLHRISVISYGRGKPVAPNTTREGRAQNRRVVIRILT
jgi:peptidoglycan-associated lipoprotein